MEMMQDPGFYALVWATFTVIGVIIGWTLRANYPERELRHALAHLEQEKNTLARLYTHIKHQHDLREADFRKASIELAALRDQLQQVELEQRQRANAAAEYGPRLAKSEASLLQYAQKVSALEVLSTGLQTRNQALSAQIERQQAELKAWQVLYRDFRDLQRQLARFEQQAAQLDGERTSLQQALDQARAQIEALQIELAQHQQRPPAPQRVSSGRNSQHGGPAAAENTDDLKLIRSITPLAEQQLFALGVHTFAQIGRWDDADILRMAKSLHISPGRIYQEDWVGQANYLAGDEQAS